jgi:hypothetical protein
MLRLSIALGFAAMTALPALAALPPQYQRQKELQAIIADAAVVDAFGFEGIGAVEFVEPDLYRVTGGNCTLEAKIVDVPNSHGEGWAGPREFAVQVGAPVCK